MYNLVYFGALLALAGTIHSQYVIDATEGCVDISVQVPGPYEVFRIDKTDYNFNGEDSCEKSWDPNDKIPCGLIEEGGKYVATAQVCEVEKHVSAGFRMDDYMQGGRYAYVMVYFSQGGSWKNIGNNCIQPSLSSSPDIDASRFSKIQLRCARLTECPMGPTTTIMTATQDLCRDYSQPECDSDNLEDKTVLLANVEKPDGEDESWVFCSTLDSYLSYHIRWV